MPKLNMPRTILLLAEVIIFAVLAVVGTSHFGIREGMEITAAYLVAYLVPCLLISRVRGTSMTARFVLLALAVMLMLSAFFCLLEWTGPEECTLQLPYLKADDRNYYKWALSRYGYPVDSPNVIFPGFPLMILALWKVLGVNVVWPQAMNMMFTMVAVVLTGITTRRLLTERVSKSHQWLLSCGMILSCLLMFYLMMGVSILKEPSTFLAVSMAGYALSSMATVEKERHKHWRDIMLFVAACVLMAFVRTTFLYFFALGVVIMVLPHWRRDWIVAMAMLVILLICMLVGDHYASYSFSRHAEIVDGGWNMQRFYIMTKNQKFYHDLLNYYFLYSCGHKLMMLPLTVSIQFVIPFPWLIYEEHTLTNLIARCTFGWYIVGGIAAFYYFFMSWRRQENIGAWAWWAAAVFIVIAYVMAGSMARYVLPFQPLFVPVATYVICRLSESRWRRLFRRWALCYVILLTMTLLVCLELQTSTISSLLHIRPLEDVLRDVIVMAES